MRAPLAALSGLITGLSALAVAELVAAAVRPEAGPVTAVGGAVVDRTPPWLKDFAVRNFGTNDKLVLQLGILALLAVFAMAVGVVAARHRLVGSAAVLVFGVVGAVAAVGRPDGSPMEVTLWQAAWRLTSGARGALPVAGDVAVAKIWASEGVRRVVQTA
ncbi:hypothetical protein ACFWNG_35320, partial [Streptomyces sp. NPDC058391]